MSTRMKGERLAAHQEMKGRALGVLEGLKGEDLHIKALRDRLGLKPDDGQAIRVLELALREARDEHHAAQGKARGWWKWAQPVQQPLPTPPPATDLAALTGLRAKTVQALEARLGHARKEHANTGYEAGDYLAALLSEVAEVARGMRDPGGDFTTEQIVAYEFLDVAVVSLRAYEALA